MVYKAIDSLKNNKSPGPTGFTKEFYVKFRKETCGWIKQLSNEVLNQTADRETIGWWRQCQTILLPKNPQKDPRPITMLNTSWKIFSVHNHLIPFLSSVLHPNQNAVRGRWIHEAHVVLSRAIDHSMH